jgi:transposase
MRPARLGSASPGRLASAGSICAWRRRRRPEGAGRSAAGLAAEVGDFRRFVRPRLLAGLLGIVPSERTSDQKRRQGSITKAGPGHARRRLVEAAHHYRYPPRIGQALARRGRARTHA